MTLQFSHELFPQLDGLDNVQDQYTQIPNNISEDYIYNQEQLGSYMYYQQRSSAHILESDTIVYPETFFTEEQCNIIYSPIQQPSIQSSIISPVSQNGSPLSIGSENFNHYSLDLQQASAPYYTYDHVMNMNLMTPPKTIYDSSPAAVHDLPPASLYNTQQHQYQQQYQYTRRSSISSISSLSSSSQSTSKCCKPKPSNTVLFHCEYEGCTKTFTRTYNLKSHRRTHTDEKPFVCHLCPKAFARQHDRNRHEKLHLGLKPYPCEYCSKSFARLDALNRHLKRDKKNNKEGSPPPCLLLQMKKAIKKKKLAKQL